MQRHQANVGRCSPTGSYHTQPLHIHSAFNPFMLSHRSGVLMSDRKLDNKQGKSDDRTHPTVPRITDSPQALTLTEPQSARV